MNRKNLLATELTEEEMLVATNIDFTHRVSREIRKSSLHLCTLSVLCGSDRSL